MSVRTTSIVLSSIAVLGIVGFAINSKGYKKVAASYTIDTLFDEIKTKMQSLGLKVVNCPEDIIIEGGKHQFCTVTHEDLKTTAGKIQDALGDGWIFDMPWRTDYGATASSFKLSSQPNLTVGFDYAPKTMAIFRRHKLIDLLRKSWVKLKGWSEIA